jgi:hypothetical protein
MAHTTGRPTGVLLIGHSYVRRLVNFQHENQRYRNLGFQPQDVLINATSRGGTLLQRTLTGRSIYHCLRSAAHVRADIIYIHIGENDLRSLAPGVFVNAMKGSSRNFGTVHHEVGDWNALFVVSTN